jgi:predicted Zn-dependent peptidase
MNRILKLCAVLYAVVACCSVVVADTIQEASERSLERLEDAVVVKKLSNGLTFVFYQRGVAPVFAAVTTVGVGGVDEQVGETGIAHMFEHMAFKGTPHIGTKDYAKEKVLLDELETIAAKHPTLTNLSKDDQSKVTRLTAALEQLWDSDAFTLAYEKRGGNDLNAQTDKDHTSYMVSLPRSAFEFWAQTESARLKEPVMRQFYQERNVVLEERRMRFDNEPAALLYESMLEKAFQMHPYRLPLIGYQKDIESLTARRLEAFRAKYYVPSNIVIAVVGAVDPDKDMPLLERYFADIPDGRIAPEPSQVEPEQREERMVMRTAPTSPQLLIAYHKPHYPHEDDAVITVLSEMLSGSSQSPLFETLVKKEKIATQVASEEGPGTRYSNLLFFTLTPRLPISNKELLQRFDQLLKQFLEQPISEELLQQAKRSIAMSFLSQMKSNLALATTLSTVQLQYHDWQEMIRWYEQALDVTADDIVRVGNAYLISTNRTIGFLEQEGKKGS